MKKLMFILLCLLPLMAVSQTTTHMVFKGVSMGVGLNNMIGQLQNQGIKFITKSDKSCMMKGTFLDKNSDFILMYSGDLLISTKVFMHLPDNWSDLRDFYDHVKELMIDKYGAPDSIMSKEEFTNGYKEGEGKEVMALVDDSVEFELWFRTDVGDIIEKMEYIEGGNYCISLMYIDKINSEKYFKDKSEKEHNEI